MTKTKNIKRIFIVTAIDETWGGSESLWFPAVPYLQQAGFQITVLKKKIDRNHKNFKILAANGVHLIDLVNLPDGLESNEVSPNDTLASITENFKIQLTLYKPNLVIINQGVNFDGLFFGLIAKNANIPYCILSHKAVDFFWPKSVEREFMKETWKNSLKNFFVSEHNLEQTQYQFGMDIPNAQRVYYPIRTFQEPLPYPEQNNGIKLACIGRFFVLDKGQDLVLRLMAQPQWRSRKIQIDFFGSGNDENGLKDLTQYLGLDGIHFPGYSEDNDIWKNYHALILPSRSEGLPLVVQEAMAAGRIVIAGNAGGTSELVADGKNGFLCEPNLTDFSNTMERAWQRKEEWESMGIQAFSDFSSFYPHDPVYQFSQHIINLIHV